MENFLIKYFASLCFVIGASMVGTAIYIAIKNR
jgi:hypothetical protein